VTWKSLTDWDLEDWRRRSACRDTDPALFFPTGTTGAAVEQLRSAKAVCRQCDVRSACLEFALAANQEAGVWGGTSEQERLGLRQAWLSRRPKPRDPAPVIPPTQHPRIPPAAAA
jgi:WhiB family redox-sensing transcriptional regulator